VLVRLKNSAIIINPKLNLLPLFILHAEVPVIIVVITIITAADPQLTQMKEDSYKKWVT
jgi:hypothetical protein